MCDPARLPQKLVKDGGTLHKQRMYEETSWKYYLVDWWLCGPLSDDSLALAIAGLENSLKLFSRPVIASARLSSERGQCSHQSTR